MNRMFACTNTPGGASSPAQHYLKRFLYHTEAQVTPHRLGCTTSRSTCLRSRRS